MYSYTWDAETGGLLLNSAPLPFSKEPRPVYYKELDILGFDRYWNYAKNDSYPYMWAEANNYFYRGRQVAKTKGGSLYTAPEIVILDDPEPNGQPLRFIDIPAMVEKNRDLLEKLSAETIKKIYNTYVEYMDRVDVFYVAFSGGKDSVVALDLVQRALPHNKFKVLFGDTGMEFPDTYKIVDQIERNCTESKIEFSQLKFLYPLKTLVFPAFSPPRFGPFPSFFPLREEMRETFFRPSLQPYPAALRKFAWPLWWRGRKCSLWYLHQNVPAAPAHPWVLPRGREGWSYMYASTDGSESHPYPRFSFGSIGIRC